MQFGSFEILTFVEQEFRLDGGSMYGIIPKSMWNKITPADDNNLIAMVTNLFVLKAHGKTFMFDSGLGDTLSDREQKIYGTDGQSRMNAGLESLGLAAGDIDYVILTHLHTDHAGGAVRLENDTYVPRFENAKYIVSEDEWADAGNPNERTGAVYVPERTQALENAGQVEFVDGNTELVPGVNIVHTGGHTRGHFGLEMESEGERVFYYSDILPMAGHLRVPVIAAADTMPLDSMNVKRRMLESIVDTGVVMAFDHDVTMPFARVISDGKRLVAQPVA